MVRKKKRVIVVNEEAVKNDYFGSLNKSIKESFGFKNGWKVFSLNLAFFILSLLVLGAFGAYFLSKLLNSGLISVLVSGQDSSAILSALQPIIVSLVVAFVLLALFNFFVKYFFSGLTWKIFIEKKFTSKFYFKFLLFNLIFGVVSAVVSSLLNLLIKIPIAGNLLYIVFFAVFTFLLVHFYLIISYKLTERDNLKEAIRQGFYEGMPVHLFLLPYLYVILVSIILAGITWGIVFLIFGKSLIANYASFISAIDSFNFDLGIMKSFFMSMIPAVICFTIVIAFLSAYIKKFYIEFVRRL
ncbi:hypothetical protein COV15_00715 [Candidatus Woesearchaeota archaeon CG10_big_fil_rev_8_21_14_0_10_34_12]|nr:MAG: hypothetical protein COV15_00715 [Candidatus Woesearchaeota archaeon CG10_big_fil_rev_8_21_14_0_10_34_12]